MKVKIKRKDIYSYHNWFAWYPVFAYPHEQEPFSAILDVYYLVWLEKIQAKKVVDRDVSFWFNRLKGKTPQINSMA